MSNSIIYINVVNNNKGVSSSYDTQINCNNCIKYNHCVCVSGNKKSCEVINNIGAGLNARSEKPVVKKAQPQLVSFNVPEEELIFEAIQLIFHAKQQFMVKEK